jgi:hypothetical protein
MVALFIHTAQIAKKACVVKVNRFTQDIAEIANVDLETALKIQNFIEEDDLLDFSEATKAQFKRAIKMVFEFHPELKVA